ncbi:MAG: polyphosphate:AMP phosphotransferase [Chitinivibrionales bacterium]|nr:polyphosphate:AMP phosphotransferase [Chitinivibrionales bacterium]
MLSNIDLSRKISKEEYKQEKQRLEITLGRLQREAKELGLSVLIVFEGWEAAGKGTLVNELILPLDPRGFKVHSILPPNEEESLRPFLWRFWTRTPAGGRIVIFDRSWCRRIFNDRVEGHIKESQFVQAVSDIRSFERQLADDGTVIIKFFLHISKEEQKKRFNKLRKNPATAWRISKLDLARHKKYESYLAAAEDMLTKTDSAFAPWTVIESHNQRFAALKMFNTVTTALQTRIDQIKTREKSPPQKKKTAPGQKSDLAVSILDKVDTSLSLDRDEYRKLLKKKQKRLRELEHEIYMQRIPIIIAYEGWDAAGKGGNIRRLTQELDPRGYEVVPVAAPNDIEKAHHYLWRFWKQIPKAGHITIFDRTWYGRVLVERVEGFCTEEQWRRAYREINEMEEHLTHFGTVLLKFWLHIDMEEQLRRFNLRQQTPHKEWKITEEDWRNREKWDDYKLAVEEMIFRTSTPHAPWTIVESNCKWFARIKVIDTVIKAIEKKLH